MRPRSPAYRATLGRDRILTPHDPAFGTVPNTDAERAAVRRLLVRHRATDLADMIGVG